jgi:hypothetical protein
MFARMLIEAVRLSPLASPPGRKPMAFDERLAARVRRALGQRTDFSERRMFGGLARRP